MRTLLNTLYITNPEAYLSKDGLNVVVTVKEEEKLRIPTVNIEAIVTFAHAGASPGLMKLCADSGISLSFLTRQGRFIGRFQGPVHGNVLLRRAQHRLLDDSERSLHLARLFIAGKIQNYQRILQRRQRDYDENADVARVVLSLGRLKNAALGAISADELRGFEGQAAADYFSVFNELLTKQRDSFSIAGRCRRPPRDPVNAMLSFAYTLIANDVASALETVGLDPYIGVFHTLRPGRTSLALDLMEEMRAYLGDRFVISLVNRCQVTPRDFASRGEQGIIMTDECRKTFISAWQQRKKEIITHPYLQEKIAIGLLPHVQSLLLARYMRGDLDDYPVFLIK